jgi:hypothetical protein
MKDGAKGSTCEHLLMAREAMDIRSNLPEFIMGIK